MCHLRNIAMGDYQGSKLMLANSKMRVEIQFCKLKIWALEKSCEFNISAKTKLLSWSHRRLSKMQWKQNQAPQNTDSLSYTIQLWTFDEVYSVPRRPRQVLVDRPRRRRSTNT